MRLSHSKALRPFHRILIYSQQPSCREFQLPVEIQQYYLLLFFTASTANWHCFIIIHLSCCFCSTKTA
ncbi:uncharacterized protein J3R85_014640 [Psidium guajava]|nr:uncharacterized protein J3R85_014640 [Psidium guajava]